MIPGATLHLFAHTASQTDCSFIPSCCKVTVLLLAAADGSPVVQGGDHLADGVALLVQGQLLFAQLVEDPRLLRGELAPHRELHRLTRYSSSVVNQLCNFTQEMSSKRFHVSEVDYCHLFQISNFW